MSRASVWIELYELSPRQAFVCQGLDQGLNYKQIAAVLDVTETTVKKQASRAMDKLGVSDQQSLARVYHLASEIAQLSSTRRQVAPRNDSGA